MLNPHLPQNQVLSWQCFLQITVISENMSVFPSEGKGLNYHDPFVDELLVLVGGIRKGFFPTLFITLVSNPPGDTLTTCWHKLTTAVIAPGKAVSSGLPETSFSSPVPSSESCLAASSSAHLLPAHLLRPPMLSCFSIFLLLQSPASPLSFYSLLSNSIKHFPFQPPSHIQIQHSLTAQILPSLPIRT